MSRFRAPSFAARRAAARVLEECGVTEIRDIDPEAMAVRYHPPAKRAMIDVEDP